MILKGQLLLRYFLVLFLVVIWGVFLFVWGGYLFIYFCLYHNSSVAQSCPTLCDPMNRSTPGLPVHHQLLEFTQIHVHQVSDAIQPSHPLLSPSPPAPSPSQHQGLSQWVMRWPKDWSLELKVLVGRSSVDLLQSQLSSYPQKHSLVLKKNNINFR